MSLARTKAHRLILAIATIAMAAACSSSPTGEEDSQPTATEYRAAVDATVECIRSEGFTTTTTPRNDGVTIAIEVTSNPKVAELAGQRLDTCLSKHLNQIEADFLAANRASGTDRELLYEQLVECLDKAGIVGAESGMSEGDLGQLIVDQKSEEERDEAFNCMSAALTLFT